MNDERILTILKGSHVSEKTANVADKDKQIVFKVMKNATKREIKSAVEDLFKVKVKRVTTIITKGKEKRFGQRLGKRSDWKKAYVSLHQGYDIHFATAE